MENTINNNISKLKVGDNNNLENIFRNINLSEQIHIHFSDGSALNIDGTWKHGSKILTNAEKKFLDSIGWVIP